MDTREKLIDLLTHDIPSGDHRGTLAFSSRVAGAIADHLIANGATVQEWIPADERPKEWRDTNGELINYLINIEGYGVDVGNCFGDAGWLCLDMPCNVTHWMPLPEPPKGVE